MNALVQGHRRYVREQQKLAVKRVREFQCWLRAGSSFSCIPEIPSNNDFKIAREKGVVC